MGNKHTRRTSGNADDADIKFHENMVLCDHNRDIEKYYTILHKLKEGSMGSVSKARRKDCKTGGSAYSNKISRKLSGEIRARPKSLKCSKEFAIKSIIQSRISKEFVEELFNEIEILRKMDHPNIVKAYEVYKSKSNIYVVMEFCSGGDLYARNPYTEKDAAKIIGKLCSALAFMHARGVVHRDLKFENIMFESTSPDAEIKLLDFGLSKKFKDGKTGMMTEGVGTIYTMSPQVMNGMYSEKADLWAVGVIAYMLICSKKPFHARNRNMMIQKILKCQYNFNDPIWQEKSSESIEFIKNLLAFDPENRMTASEALKHAWQNKQFNLSERAPDQATMMNITNHLQCYAAVSDLQKMALMVIAHQSSTEEIADMRAVFDQYDQDNEGTISLDEFKEALKHTNLSDSQKEELFAKIDISHTDEIEYKEFIAATLAARGRIEEERVAEAFDRIDSDDSGYITRQNLRDMLGRDYTEERVDQIMEQTDENKDGKISFTEFLNAFRNWEDRTFEGWEESWRSCQTIFSDDDSKEKNEIS